MLSKDKDGNLIRILNYSLSLDNFLSRISAFNLKVCLCFNPKVYHFGILRHNRNVMGNGVDPRNFEKRYSLMTSNAVDIIEIPESCTIKINL